MRQEVANYRILSCPNVPFYITFIIDIQLIILQEQHSLLQTLIPKDLWFKMSLKLILPIFLASLIIMPNQSGTTYISRPQNVEIFFNPSPLSAFSHWLLIKVPNNLPYYIRVWRTPSSLLVRTSYADGTAVGRGDLVMDATWEDGTVNSGDPGTKFNRKS